MNEWVPPVFFAMAKQPDRVKGRPRKILFERERICPSPAGRRFATLTFYCPRGFIEEIHTCDAQGEASRREIFDRDSLGRVVVSKLMDSLGTVQLRSEYFYDRNETRQVLLDSAGNVTETITIKYDAVGRVLEVECLESGKAASALHVDVSFDEEGRSTLRWKFHDLSPLVVSEVMLDGKQQIPAVDERIDLIDEFGNWSAKTIIEDGRVVERHYRTIEYHSDR